MNNIIKKAIVNVLPYGIVEIRRRKQREIDIEQKRIEKEERKRQSAIEREKKEKEKEEARRRRQEKKRKIEEEKKRQFLNSPSSKDWCRFYADFHEKEEVEEKWILYEAYGGSGMVCGPYAVFQSFLKIPEFLEYIHIWVVAEEREMVLLQQEYQKYENVLFIYYQSKAYAYFAAKAKYLVNNDVFPDMISKKEGQVLVNTWHGITVKTAGYDMPDGNRRVKNTIRNLLMSDYIVSANDFMTKIFEEAFRLAGLFEGHYIQAGPLENDRAEHMEKEEIFHKLSVRGVEADNDKNIILYAPAWMENDEGSLRAANMKYADLYKCLSERINMEKYQILIKLHPFEYKNLSEEERKNGYYIPEGIDIGELLAVTDLLITDYSGVCFEFAGKKKPVIFYVPDYKKYKDKGRLYFKLEELPGVCVENLEMLAEKINHMEEYPGEAALFQEQLRGWTDNRGNAAGKVIDIVLGNKQEAGLLSTKKTGKKKILMFAGNLFTSGVTSAALGLLNAIDFDIYDVSLFVMYLKTDMQNYNFDRLPKEIRVLLRCDAPVMTEEQNRVFNAVRQNGFGIAPEDMPMQEYLMKREYMRCFGESRFDYVLNFSGTVMFSCFVLKQCPNAKKILWLHNDMKHDFMNEVRRVMHNIITTEEGHLSVYPFYQKIVSVNKVIYEINKNALGTEKTRDKFAYCTNLLDEKQIEKSLREIESCKCNGKEYIKIVKECGLNGVQQAMLIPYESERIKFVTVGRCVSEKNHKNIILALKRLIEEGVPCSLYIVGDGYMREELENLAEELGISDFVIITGFVTNPYAIMKRCDCFIFPSVYEGQGLAVLEARIAGLPIVVSNYSAVESVFLEDKQYVMDGTDVDVVYNGMRAYLDGKVPKNYHFDVKEYNRKAYQEFVDLLEKG